MTSKKKKKKKKLLTNKQIAISFKYISITKKVCLSAFPRWPNSLM